MNNIIKIVSCLSQIAYASGSTPKILNSTLFVTGAAVLNKITELNDVNLKFDTLEDTYEIDLSPWSRSVLFCVNDIEFYQNSNNNSNALKKDWLVILMHQDTYLLFDTEKKETFMCGQKSDKNHIFTNTISYIKLRDKLKSLDFADYVSFADEEIIFYTGTKGVCKLKIPNVPISLETSINYALPVNELLELLDSKDFIVHFKNSLFGLQKADSSSQIRSLMSNIDSLLQESKNSLELYLKNFSFDKLKNDLHKEKDKYFTSLREILSKILSQVVGVPVSIAASTFASYKIESTYILYLILLSFFVYILFAIYIQSIYLKDIKEIELDFKNDFDTIKKDSGLTEEIINKEKHKITRRIEVIKKIIHIFIGVISVLFLLFAFYMIHQIRNFENDEVPSKHHFTVTISSKESY